VRRAQSNFFLFIILAGFVAFLSTIHPVLHTIASIFIIAFLYGVLQRSGHNLFQSPPVSSAGYVFALEALLLLIMLACGVLLLSSVFFWLGDGALGRISDEVRRSAGTIRFSFLTVLNLIILVPLYEELFFRGYLLNAYRCIGDHFAIVSSAVLFAVGHQVFFNSLYTFFLGLVLAILTIRYNSILPPFLFHMINNFVAIFPAVGNIDHPEATSEPMDALQFTEAVAGARRWILPCLIVLVGALYILYRVCKRLRRQSEAETPLNMTIYEAGQILFHWPVVLMTGGFLLRLFRWAENWLAFFTRAMH
jgi:membrane protease YdiL (CAAX protease family)